jgi:ribonuclease Z
LFGANNKFIVFTLIPLVLSIGIVPAIPFSDAAESNQICIDKVWLENTKGKIACVTPSTADTLVERGWGTILEVLEDAPMEMIPYMPGDKIDSEAEQRLLSIADGGVGPLTVTTVLGNPTKAYPEVYVPRDENLALDEMRLVFCGTGFPYLTVSQASTCLIVQTGDGKSYLFDIGSGSASRINAMEIPGNDLTNVFISHTHTDHIGDLGPFWSQAYLSGRTNPIELYGPSGPNHELGLTYFVENFLKSYTWDFETRRGMVDTSGQAINIHEFDYAQTQVIYDQDDFQVTAFPAIHGIDGAVSFRIDWNDLSVVFSGDTDVNQFLLENSHNVDVIILETFAPEEYFLESFGWPEGMYDGSVSTSHIPAERAGLYFEIVEPRLAIGFHFILDELSVPLIFEGIRKNYDDPFLYAQDFTVINVTPDYIITRQALVDENFVPGSEEKMEIQDERKYVYSDWLKETVLHEDALREILDAKNEN